MYHFFSGKVFGFGYLLCGSFLSWINIDIFFLWNSIFTLIELSGAWQIWNQVFWLWCSFQVKCFDFCDESHELKLLLNVIINDNSGPISEIEYLRGRKYFLKTHVFKSGCHDRNLDWNKSNRINCHMNHSVAKSYNLAIDNSISQYYQYSMGMLLLRIFFYVLLLSTIGMTIDDRSCS